MEVDEHQLTSRQQEMTNKLTSLHQQLEDKLQLLDKTIDSVTAIEQRLNKMTTNH
jgi:prefoldin subunit 5